MKYVFTGGGTLGHTNPAIAVAEKVREMDKEADILFVMRKGGRENESVAKRGFRLSEIDAIGLDRGTGIKSIKTLSTTTKGIFQCNKILKEFGPDVIFGTGGYVSFAPLFAGILRKIPTFIHESNSSPGLVTKIMAKMGTTVLINLETTKTKLPAKTKVFTVGNPILPEFNKITRTEARARLKLGEETYILSFGGSGGSKIMNEIIYDAMTDLSSNKKIRHTHVCGEKYFEDAKSRFPEWVRGSKSSHIYPRISDMATHLKAADIVICRCGAMTISEIIRMGKAAILIPSPNVTDNHQYENGLYLKERNAAIMIEEKDLTKELLLEKITLMAESRAERERLETNIKKLDVRDSAEKISIFLINAK